MPKQLWTGILLCLFAGFLPAQDVGTIPNAVPPIYALTGATVVVGDGQVLEGATVVLQDGLIHSVGSGIPIPPGAWTLDLSGMYVYPGLIDALTNDGLSKDQAAAQPSAQAGGRGRRASGPASKEGPGYFAHIAAANLINKDDNSLEGWRDAGILAINITPDQGIFQGTSAVVSLNGGEADEMIVGAATGMSMSFRTLGFRIFPGSLMGVIAHIRQTLSDAQHYKMAWAEYSRDKKGMKRPPTDRTLEALQPVLDGKLPLIFPAQREREIRRSLQLCQQVSARCIVAGGFEAPATADELKQHSADVLVSLNYPKKPRDPHPDDQESLDSLRYRVNAPAAAGQLASAGVRFAFYSGGANARDFVGNIRTAVQRGLTREAAIRAATLAAAEILGVDDQLGSITPGKIANVIVSDSDLMEENSQIRHVFVDGLHHEIEIKKTPDKKGEGGAPVSMAGQWDVTVTPPGQTVELTFDLTQDGTTVSGTVTSEQGSLSIYDGAVTGNSFSFKMDTDLGNGPTTITFSGTVTDDSLTGSADVAGMGTAPMEGRKVPR